ncbi:MAG: Holliday junction resolvase RuvX [Parachlamydiaceae bacterium]|nr:Holliday junction resolvase RuvX [Parachlamydiaceae bacterium]
MNSIPSEKKLPKRILGIDYGQKRLGLAISDERKIIATPLITFLAEQRSEQTVAKFIDYITKLQESNKYIIEEMVIGLPLMMNGTTGLLADEVKHFVSLLEKSCAIPIKTWDERLSTVQAERSLREGHMTRRQRTKVVDTVSATIILQSYLDSKGNTFALS